MKFTIIPVFALASFAVASPAPVSPESPKTSVAPARSATYRAYEGKNQGSQSGCTGGLIGKVNQANNGESECVTVTNAACVTQEQHTGNYQECAVAMWTDANCKEGQTRRGFLKDGDFGNVNFGSFKAMCSG
ncbi:hypothetical protein F5B20DRAFT_186332 [Whalleya microplaca]|nr:hypothetical protein F5B20DRAFT_186332 [Whalleya microplaca]